MEFIREDCIYARQSVDRKDSISIESQIDFCKYELKGGSCRVFKDKGYSGKNTDRPEFQKLLGEIRKGKVRRVIVYKLDRISRSILDFANMMELFQEYDVEFVSSTEKFDTSTPMGRAMLNICIVFARLERETIQKRVTDAYYSRCLKGFHMSGQAPYGYQLEPTVVEGIRTKKMVADPVAADHVRLMFEMYAEPETSFGDITRYFEEQGIKIYEKSMVRSFLSQLLRNPVYAQADLELYEFFKSQGAAIVNDASVRKKVKSGTIASILRTRAGTGCKRSTPAPRASPKRKPCSAGRWRTTRKSGLWRKRKTSPWAICWICGWRKN